MNPITKLFSAVRYTNELNAHIKRVLAARGPIDPAAILASWRERPGPRIGSYLDSLAFERFLDWLEANPSVKWVMISEFDDKRPYTRADLKDIFLSLRVGGVRDGDIMQTFAFKSALVYLARAMRRGERHDVIVFTLREHWERRQKLPVEARATELAMLGLRRPFTTAQVRQAYRQKSLKAHPDQGGVTDFMIALQRARDAALTEADD